MNRNLYKLLFFVLSLSLGGAAYSSQAVLDAVDSKAKFVTPQPSLPRSLLDAARCQIIHAQPNHRYLLTSSLNLGTHIIFPENAVDVVVGSKDLWNQAHSLNHVFIKPNSNEKEGGLTTLSFISESNNSYDFIVQRVPASQASTCVVVQSDQSMLNKLAWNNFSTKDERMMRLLADKIAEQKAQMVMQQRSAMEKYRSTIYTHYSWNRHAGLFNRNYISDVYDDQRWTYIRVAHDSSPVMAIYGVLHGKKNLLEFTYDASSRVYRIPGIYEGITVAYGDVKIPITRKSS